MSTKTTARPRASKYPEPVRRWALSIAGEKGLAEAHRETEVPKPTIERWAKAAGVEVFVEQAAREKTEHARTERERLLAEKQLARVDALLRVSELSLAEQVRLLESTDATVKDLPGVVGAGTRALHDLRLETDQATENVGVVVHFNVPLPMKTPPAVTREGA